MCEVYLRLLVSRNEKKILKEVKKYAEVISHILQGLV
jgi:hypothetical protein